MATLSSVQSILGTSLVGASNNVRANNLALPRNSKLNLRCMATDGKKEESPPIDTPLSSSTPTPTPMPVKPKVSTDFDLFAFSETAPERINGRLAMVGFVSAITVQVANGQDVFSQISSGGVPWFLGTSAVLSLSSLIPLFKGKRAESAKSTFMSPNAELWNGRFAMLGLVALAFTEYVKGSALSRFIDMFICPFDEV